MANWDEDEKQKKTSKKKEDKISLASQKDICSPPWFPSNLFSSSFNTSTDFVSHLNVIHSELYIFFYLHLQTQIDKYKFYWLANQTKKKFIFPLVHARGRDGGEWSAIEYVIMGSPAILVFWSALSFFFFVLLALHVFSHTSFLFFF